VALDYVIVKDERFIDWVILSGLKDIITNIVDDFFKIHPSGGTESIQKYNVTFAVEWTETPLKPPRVVIASSFMKQTPLGFSQFEEEENTSYNAPFQAEGTATAIIVHHANWGARHLRTIVGSAFASKQFQDYLEAYGITYNKQINYGSIVLENYGTLKYYRTDVSFWFRAEWAIGEAVPDAELIDKVSSQTEFIL